MVLEKTKYHLNWLKDFVESPTDFNRNLLLISIPSKTFPNLVKRA